MPKRVLLVDDDPTVTLVLAESLERLGGQYVIETAQDAHKALDRIEQGPLDLIITDLRMPGMDGLELIQQVRARAPHTRLILMTGYGSTEIEATAYHLGACRYLDKPFKAERLVAEVQAALAEPELPGRDVLVLSDDQAETVARCLADLRFEVGAQCILLADIAGQMVANVGMTEDLDLTALVSLVGGGFAAAFEMVRYLGESQARTLNYHDGDRYDIYSSNVNDNLFVVLLFDKRPHQAGKGTTQRSRIGMVWLYTRRALEQLQTTVSSATWVQASELVDADFGARRGDSLDQFLVDAGADSLAVGPWPPDEADKVEPRVPGAVVGWGDVEVIKAGGGLAQHQTNTRLPEAPVPPPTPTTDDSTETVETFDLQQALELGLLDPSWLQDDLS
jgi:CheY-like chemotaxis protein